MSGLPSAPELVHATCVAINGHGMLLMGASGSGKSDLALRLIDRGAVLVSDDYCACSGHDGTLFIAPPERIAGKLEVRHIGIITLPYATNVPVALAIGLDDKPPRMPDGSSLIAVAGVNLPFVQLAPREASAPIKAEIALRQAVEERVA